MSEPIPATEQYRTKVATAAAMGGTVPAITHVAWGADGTPAPITANALRDLVHIQPVNSAIATGPLLSIITVLRGEDAAGRAIRELGLFDADGDMAARRTFSPKELDAGTEFETTLELQF